jgi:hypothetical protein
VFALVHRAPTFRWAFRPQNAIIYSLVSGLRCRLGLHNELIVDA